MRTLTFTEQGLTITVREEIGADVFDEDNVFAALTGIIDSDPMHRVIKFSSFVMRTVSIEGELGFKWPTSVLDKEAIRAAYPAWCNLNPALMRAWRKKLEEVSTPPGDVDLHPKAAGEA